MASVSSLYEAFAGYPPPADPWVCPLCAQGITAADVAATPLVSLTFDQLAAIHVMALDDDALRHYFPRLMELLLVTPAPVLDFRVADLKSRIVRWMPAERSAAGQLAEAVWAGALTSYPLDCGYFSDCPAAVDLLNCCGLPLLPRLDRLMAADSLASARHLADLVDAVFTSPEPFEMASRAMVLGWLGAAEVGARLQNAFFAVGSDDAARQLSAAHLLWTVCVPRPTC